MPVTPLLTLDLPGFPPPKRGKVREVFDLGDRLLFVATDRISAFDYGRYLSKCVYFHDQQL